MIYSGRHSSIYFLITLMYCNFVRHTVESNLYSEFNDELDKVSNYAENRAKAETLATMGKIYDHNDELLRKHLQNIQLKDMRNANELDRNAEIEKLINVLSPYHEPWPGSYPSRNELLWDSRESFAQDPQTACPTKHKNREIKRNLPRAYKSQRFKKNIPSKYRMKYDQMQRKKRLGEQNFVPKALLNTAPSEYPNVVANLLDVRKFNDMKNFSPLNIPSEKNTAYNTKEVQDALQQQSQTHLLNAPSFGSDTGYDYKTQSISAAISSQEQNNQIPQQSNQIPRQIAPIPQQCGQPLQQNSQIPQQNIQTPQQNIQTPQQNIQTLQQNIQTPQQNIQIPQQNTQITQPCQLCQQTPAVQLNTPQMPNQDQSHSRPLQMQSPQFNQPHKTPNQDQNRSEIQQMTDLKGVLEKVLDELEGIKQCSNDSTSKPPDGIPCDIMGSWNSDVLGLRFDISSDVKGLNVDLRERTPPKRHTIMDLDWSCTGGSIKKPGGPFFITAEKTEENTMAVFSGMCKRCGGADTIFGSWTVIRPSKSCEDVQVAIETRRDVFRRNELQKKKKQRLEKIHKARSKDKES